MCIKRTARTLVILIIVSSFATAASSPTIENVEPLNGPSSGGTELTIRGAHFFAGAAVTIGDQSAIDVTFIDHQTLKAKTPSLLLAGLTLTDATEFHRPVRVTNPDGGSTTSNSSFNYRFIPVSAPLPPLQITFFEPKEASRKGGRAITIFGSGFSLSTKVYLARLGRPLGEAPIPLKTTYQTSTALHAISPREFPGSFRLIAMNGRQETATAKENFTIAELAATADRETAKAFPNPFKRSSGASSITFNVPAASTIKIFTVSGKLVKELKDNGTGTTSWNVKNKGGQEVGSGMYIYQIISPDRSSKTGRVGVLR